MGIFDKDLIYEPDPSVKALEIANKRILELEAEVVKLRELVASTSDTETSC